MLLGVGLSHRGLLIIVHTLHLINLFQVGCLKHLLDLGLLGPRHANLIKNGGEFRRTTEVRAENLSAYSKHGVEYIIEGLCLLVVGV